MEITEVKVFPIQEEKLKAFVSIVFDRCFMVNDIKIIQGRDGLFISMPSRKKKNGEFKDVAHPLNNETRRMIEIEVVAEYERVLAERGEELPAPPRPYPGAGDPAPETAASEGDGATAEGRAVVEPRPRPAPAPAAPEVLPIAAAPADGGGGGAGGEGSDEVAEPDQAASLEEVQEKHLRDSFWSVS